MQSYKLKGSSQEDCLMISGAKVQEEEFCRILDLRKSLQFSDMLIKHLSHYLSLGWQLAVVNSQSRVQQWLNFQEPQETWSEKLIELSLDGFEVNVGVQTGSPSRLMILEVPKQGRTLPFRREDWSANCVAEAGALFEQHYYELPEGWRPPPSFVLEPFEVKVFGEGDLVLTPPSLEPRTQANWRWLSPPWDSAPRPPSPILKKIIKVAAPVPEASLPAPVIPSWEEIYPEIAPHSMVMQALMSPAASPEGYYQNLLEAAVAEGLKEPQLLLALMWHAPLGDVRERPQGWEYLQHLLKQEGLAEEYRGEAGPDNGDHQVAAVRALFEEPRRLAEARQGFPPADRDNGGRASFTQPSGAADWRGKEHIPHNQQQGGFSHDTWGFGWQELFKASQENLVVERHRYEAMIYELGKLQVWQEICQQERRENQRLHRKLEAQIAREVDYLRYLLKKNS
jgi:hypothetical protein